MYDSLRYEDIKTPRRRRKDTTQDDSLVATASIPIPKDISAKKGTAACVSIHAELYGIQKVWLHTQCYDYEDEGHVCNDEVKKQMYMDLIAFSKPPPMVAVKVEPEKKTLLQILKRTDPLFANIEGHDW